MAVCVRMYVFLRSLPGLAGHHAELGALMKTDCASLVALRVIKLPFFRRSGSAHFKFGRTLKRFPGQREDEVCVWYWC